MLVASRLGQAHVSRFRVARQRSSLPVSSDTIYGCRSYYVHEFRAIALRKRPQSSSPIEGQSRPHPQHQSAEVASPCHIRFQTLARRPAIRPIWDSAKGRGVSSIRSAQMILRTIENSPPLGHRNTTMYNSHRPSLRTGHFPAFLSICHFERSHRSKVCVGPNAAPRLLGQYLAHAHVPLSRPPAILYVRQTASRHSTERRSQARYRELSARALSRPIQERL